MSIVVENITKVYGSQKALDDVTFRISAGEVVGLLGPNGAGKSTLMKIITCFIPPTSGMVKVYGNDILEHSLEVRRKIGYLPENNPLYSDLYVREYLEFVAGIYRVSDKKKAVAEMIGITGLKTEQNKKIGMLSKGFRQRVGLAQALIHNPDVLILDEPTSGLDPNQLIEIRNLIRETGREKTVLLSTHIMHEVEAVCSRAIIIDRGKIVADDSTANLLKNASTRQVNIIEFNKHVNKEDLDNIKGVIRANLLKENTFEVEFENPDVKNEIIKFSEKLNSSVVISIQQSKRGLEDLFRELTKNEITVKADKINYTEFFESEHVIKERWENIEMVISKLDTPIDIFDASNLEKQEKNKQIALNELIKIIYTDPNLNLLIKQNSISPQDLIFIFNKLVQFGAGKDVATISLVNPFTLKFLLQYFNGKGF